METGSLAGEAVVSASSSEQGISLTSATFTFLSRCPGHPSKPRTAHAGSGPSRRHTPRPLRRSFKPSGASDFGDPRRQSPFQPLGTVN